MTKLAQIRAVVADTNLQHVIELLCVTEQGEEVAVQIDNLCYPESRMLWERRSSLPGKYLEYRVAFVRLRPDLPKAWAPIDYAIQKDPFQVLGASEPGSSCSPPESTCPAPPESDDPSGGSERSE